MVELDKIPIFNMILESFRVYLDLSKHLLSNTL